MINLLFQSVLYFCKSFKETLTLISHLSYVRHYILKSFRIIDLLIREVTKTINIHMKNIKLNKKYS